MIDTAPALPPLVRALYRASLLAHVRASMPAAPAMRMPRLPGRVATARVPRLRTTLRPVSIRPLYLETVQ